jgi:hypothetical protein
MADPALAQLEAAMADRTMGTRIEVAWLEPPPWIIDTRRYATHVRFDAERNVIEITCCPPESEDQCA